ncbi:unnamed protein product [Symbiodinium natans]|uniref:Uncharacterized protein n=1 Tax=Symbiodinium natans TaxID=878477 RepID=A0A812PWA6_9DINO|nr:unnamed protein product [Symbiodinium natans]
MPIRPEDQITWGGVLLPRIETLEPRIRGVALERYYLPKLAENGYAQAPQLLKRHCFEGTESLEGLLVVGQVPPGHRPCNRSGASPARPSAATCAGDRAGSRFALPQEHFQRALLKDIP